jgi:hypothetical protein
MASGKIPPPALSAESRVRAVSNQVSANLEDEMVILSLADGVYYGLDPLGTRIWGLLQKPLKIGEIRDLLLEEYEVESRRCEEDLLKLLTDLASRGLIDIENEPVA